MCAKVDIISNKKHPLYLSGEPDYAAEKVVGEKLLCHAVLAVDGAHAAEMVCRKIVITGNTAGYVHVASAEQ